MTPERWAALNDPLDRVLDLPASERPAHLAALARSDPALVAQLEQLLARIGDLDGDEFMVTSPVAQIVGAQAAGMVVGAYTLLRVLGQGGMGQVWLARRNDDQYQAEVAIKFLAVHRLGRGEALRFRREGQALARLDHPHIARLLDAGVVQGKPYLVMELVRGLPLDATMAELNLPARLRLFQAVLAAVAHAHGRLVLHRDLKPSNILVTPEGQVKLLDFGVAKLLGADGAHADPADSQLTELAGNAFTLRYAAPEQVRNDDVSTATDVYALGVLMFELLTGEHPTPGVVAGGMAGMHAVLDEEVRALPALTRARPSRRRTAGERHVDLPDLATLLGKALKKAPHERYRDAAEMAEDLRRLLAHQPLTARPDDMGYRARKFLRRNAWPVAAGMSVLLAVSVGSVVSLVQAHEARQQRAQSERLIEYMLNDLRLKLEPLDRMDVLDSVGREVLAHYASQSPDDLDPAAQGRRARALYLVTEMAINAGRDDEALSAATLASQGTARLMALAPNEARSLGLHGLSRYWLAYATEQKFGLAAAAASYAEADALVQRARALAPDEHEWRRAWMLTHESVGSTALFQLRLEPALTAFRETEAMAVQLAAKRPEIWSEVAMLRSWMGRTLHDMLRYDEAIAACEAQLEAQQRAPEHVRNRHWVTALSRGVRRIAIVKAAQDRPSEALVPARQALDLAVQAAAGDPTNVEKLMTLAEVRLLLAELFSRTGEQKAALAQWQQAGELLTRLRTMAPDAVRLQVELQGRWLANAAAWRLPDGLVPERLQAYLSDASRVQQSGRALTAAQVAQVADVALALGDLLARRGQAEQARQVWHAAADQAEAAMTPTAYDLQMMQALLLTRLGQGARADTVVQRLRKLGYSPAQLKRLAAA
jgi:eukaryotic-like serine/threonine-protein kinase